MSHTDLLINIAVISVVLLLFTGRNPRLNDGLWFLVHSAILGCAAAIYIYRWNSLVYPLAAVSLIFVIVPLGLMIVGTRRQMAGREKAAALLFRLAALLHPTSGWRFVARLVAIMADRSRERQCAALQRLEGDAKAGQALIARLHRLRLLTDWEGLLVIPEPTGQEVEAAPLWALFRLQALGEVGRIDEMAAWYFTNAKRFERMVPEEQVLFPLLVYTGKYERVEALLRRQEQAGRKDEDTAFWVAHLSRLIAGQEAARQPLEAFAARMPDPMRRNLMQRRLATPLPDPRALTAEYSNRIDQLADAYFDPNAIRPPKRTPRVTALLLTAIIIGYIYEMTLGDPTSPRVLAEAGGMWPPYVEDGEWWRLGTALFLHSGWVHLLFNALALYVLGSAVEQRIGWWRTLIVYAAGGVLSSAFVYWMMMQVYAQDAVLVGASGAIMALLAALACLVVADWMRTRAARDFNALTSIMAVVGLQVVVDFIIPNVSFAAHLGGFIAGIGIMVILILFRR